MRVTMRQRLRHQMKRGRDRCARNLRVSLSGGDLLRLRFAAHDAANHSVLRNIRNCSPRHAEPRSTAAGSDTLPSLRWKPLEEEQRAPPAGAPAPQGE